MKDCEVESDFPSNGASRTECHELDAWDRCPSEKGDLSRVVHSLSCGCKIRTKLIDTLTDDIPTPLAPPSLSQLTNYSVRNIKSATI